MFRLQKGQEGPSRECSNIISWKQSAGQRWREAARCMRERLSGTQIESCALGALQARPEEHLKHPDRWLLFEQLLFVQNRVTLSEKMRPAFLVSIPLALLTSSEVLFMCPPEQMCHLSEQSQLVPVRGCACSIRILWKQSAGQRWREAARCMRERLTRTEIESWAFVFAKACDSVGEDEFSVASQHSIALSTSCELSTFMCPPSRYVTWYVGSMPTCSSERLCLFDQNFLRAVGRAEMEGSCKVYVGKTNWNTNRKLYPLHPCKQEVRSAWSTLTDNSYSSSLYLLQSMWQCRRRCV